MPKFADLVSPANAEAIELEITRTFAAPRELVWQAWTDPEMARQWMGPRGFQTTEFVTGSRPGEPWRLAMQGHVPGTEQLVTLRQGGVIREWRPPELLSYTFAWDDRASVGLAPSRHKESLVTIRLEDHGDTTVMYFTQGPFESAGERDGHTGGWNSAFDALFEFLSTEQPAKALEIPGELHVKRFIAAPRAVVFEAWTKGERLAQWWGPEGFSNPRCEVDARHDGPLRIDMRAPDGTIFPMSGRFLEVYPPYRLNFVATPLDDQGKAIFETWTSVFFEELDGGTLLTLDVHLRSSTAAATAMLKGMPQGWSQSLDRLKTLTQSQPVTFAKEKA